MIEIEPFIFHKKLKELIISKFLTASKSGYPINKNSKNYGKVGLLFESLFNIQQNHSPDADLIEIFELKSRYSEKSYITLFSQKPKQIANHTEIKNLMLSDQIIVPKSNLLLAFDREELKDHVERKLPSLAFVECALRKDSKTQEVYVFFEKLNLYYDTSFNKFRNLIRYNIIKVYKKGSSYQFRIKKENLKQLYNTNEEFIGTIAPHDIHKKK